MPEPKLPTKWVVLVKSKRADPWSYWQACGTRKYALAYAKGLRPHVFKFARVVRYEAVR